ncbi:MAG TPA: acyltransferase [Catalimonadaceae bacterium]|nr:acyltransferase [Catalimonadaceae bacterium]
MTNSEQPRFFPALTGLRFVAAVLVLLFHYERSNPLYPEFLQKCVAEFYIGVSLFFVLSGFLITHRYYDSGPGSKFSFGIYLKNRFARIYPLFFILATLTFLIRFFYSSAFPEEEPRIYLLSVSLLRGFSEVYYLQGMSQSWSLSVEELFYLLAPVIFFLVRKNRFWWIGLPFLIIAFGLCIVRFFTWFPFHGFFENTSFMLRYTFFGRSLEFFIGMALAIQFRKSGGAFSKKRGFRFTFSGIGGIVACVGLLAWLKGDLEFGLLNPQGLWIHNFLLPAIGFAPLIWGLITEENVLVRWLSSNAGQVLGKSSYALYLLHLGVFYSLLSRISDNTLFLFPAMVILSVFVWRFIEEPMHRFFRAEKGNSSTSG